MRLARGCACVSVVLALVAAIPGQDLRLHFAEVSWAIVIGLCAIAVLIRADLKGQ